MFDPSHSAVAREYRQHLCLTPDQQAIPEQYQLSNSQSTAHSFVNVESEFEPPKELGFHKALEAIALSGLNDLILRLYEHANSLHDIRQIEHHTVLIPTKEAFLNLGEEACAALETEKGRPHLAAIFRHNNSLTGILDLDLVCEHVVTKDRRQVRPTFLGFQRSACLLT